MEFMFASVDGVWVGKYQPYIAGAFHPSFRATIMSTGSDSRFTGKISDIGPGGDAEIVGQRDGRKINFTAFYYSPQTKQPVCETAFAGLLSEDGDCISGHWEIQSGFFRTVSGPWQVIRVNSYRANEAGAAWPPPVSKAYGKLI